VIEAIRTDRVQIQQVIAMLIIFAFNMLFWMPFEQAGSSFNFLAHHIVDRNLSRWEFPISWFPSVNPLAIVLQTVGELCLSPISLSMVTKLAPPRLVGAAMGGWLLTLAVGGNLSGLLASSISGASGMTASSALSGFTFGCWLLAGAGVLLLLISPLINKLMHGYVEGREWRVGNRESLQAKASDMLLRLPLPVTTAIDCRIAKSLDCPIPLALKKTTQDHQTWTIFSSNRPCNPSSTGMRAAASGRASGPPVTPEQMRLRVASQFEAWNRQPPPLESMRDLDIPRGAGMRRARWYDPDGRAHAPLLLDLHGGGWVVGDLEIEDRALRMLALESGAKIVSLDYRLAPGHPRSPPPSKIRWRPSNGCASTRRNLAGLHGHWRWAGHRQAPTLCWPWHCGCAMKPCHCRPSWCSFTASMESTATPNPIVCSAPPSSVVRLPTWSFSIPRMRVRRSKGAIHWWRRCWRT